MNLKKITVRQAKMLAEKLGTCAFSCNIAAPNGFYGLSTVVNAFGHVLIVAPYEWER